ncbi:MAG: hypothetical protein ACRD0R_11785 [Acidimicrobiales bacterium]
MDDAAGTATADGGATPTEVSGTTIGGPDAAASSRGRRALLVAGLTVVVTLPLLVALVALRTPRWYPLLDLAMTELRVRDVGTGHSPLIGLVGRLSSNGNQGSHPGPLSFWALAPIHRLLGGSAWSLMVGVVALNTAAVALTLWVALRRGGAALAVGFAAGFAVLVHLYGTHVLTEPWNPYMPVMWWPLTLVAVWAVLDDDLAMLPVAVFAGSFCMQTHISYLGIVAGIAALAVAGLALRAWRLRDDRPARRRLAAWSGAALALGLVLWLPPVIDQVVNDPGNASVVLDHFLEAEDEPIGIARGAELFAVHLDPWRLVAGRGAISGSVVPGLLLVAVWAAAAVATWRMTPGRGDAGSRTKLLRLHVVVAAALVLGLVSAVRILGFVWHYLLLWGWGTTTLTLVAVGWSAVLAARRAGPQAGRLATRAAVALAVVVLVGWTAVFAAGSRDAQPTQHRVSEAVGDVTAPLLAAIDRGDVAPEGRDARYLITWTDGTYIGSPGYALVTELERRGLDVGVAPPQGPGAVEHRVLLPADADAEVHVSVGPDIALWESRADATMIAYADPRTEAQRARFERARRDSIDALVALGRDDLVELVDLAPFMLFLDDSLPESTRATIAPLGDIGQPLAVFVTTDVG